MLMYWFLSFKVYLRRGFSSLMDECFAYNSKLSSRSSNYISSCTVLMPLSQLGVQEYFLSNIAHFNNGHCNYNLFPLVIMEECL